MMRKLALGALVVSAAGALSQGEANLEVGLSAQTATVNAPYFDVDPFWPKPLPNHWVLGSTIGVSVDDRDHVWIIHRPGSIDDNFKAAVVTPQVGRCCTPAPPVLEFDQAGNLVGHWGGPGPGYEWPVSNHGITVDHKGNVWIGGNDEAKDTQVLKFTRQGKFILQIGKQGVHNGSNDTQNLWRAAKIFVDPPTNEAYIADGYGNRRVIVFDADTGKYKRHWGAYGKKPDDTNLGNYNPDAPIAQQFRNPVHCAELSNDNLLYVCDRVNDRIQVFTPAGKFLKEAFIAKKSLGEGSVWDIAFSKDPQQTYIFLADGRNMKIRILKRDTLEELTNFGDGGRQPGQFYAPHSLAVDSKGNLYTTETYEGKRVQRFVFKGLRPVPAKDQGVVWPRS